MSVEYQGYQGDHCNLQAVYDFVAAHLLKQGRRATVAVGLRKGSNCRLRGDAGTMCAVGCLIPDVDYRPSMEDSVAYDWTEDRFKVAKRSGLLESLRTLHDFRVAADWPKALRNLATRHRLSPIPQRRLSPKNGC